VFDAFDELRDHTVVVPLLRTICTDATSYEPPPLSTLRYYLKLRLDVETTPVIIGEVIVPEVRAPVE
jgi:hypothetical protein